MDRGRPGLVVVLAEKVCFVLVTMMKVHMNARMRRSAPVHFEIIWIMTDFLSAGYSHRACLLFIMAAACDVVQTSCASTQAITT